MRELTLKQAEIVTAILQYNNKHGYSPTVREIGNMVGLKSPSTVQQHLNHLEKMGAIEKNPASPRTIRVKMGDM